MNARPATICLVTLSLACTAQTDRPARDTGTRPDTAAIQGAGTVPHPTPAAADSAVARDSAARTRRP